MGKRKQPSLKQLRVVAASCRACELYKRGTQTVFGAGAARAQVMFVGEQPGNDEDLAGEPFVGPAGRLLVKALVEAGIDRKQVYVTNAVKHFKWVAKGVEGHDPGSHFCDYIGVLRANVKNRDSRRRIARRNVLRLLPEAS